MPQQIIREGKMYVEYSATELDDIRHKQAEELAKTRGWKPSYNVFEQNHSTNPTHRKWKGNLG